MMTSVHSTLTTPLVRAILAGASVAVVACASSPTPSRTASTAGPQLERAHEPYSSGGEADLRRCGRHEQLVVYNGEPRAIRLIALEAIGSPTGTRGRELGDVPASRTDTLVIVNLDMPIVQALPLQQDAIPRPNSTNPPPINLPTKVRFSCTKSESAASGR